MNEYISIKEFATRAGVSTQAIYQRLDKDLQHFLKLIDKRKMLDIDGLRLFLDADGCKEVDKQLTSDLQAVDKRLVDVLQETLKTLSAQLEAKDKQIANLNERLKEAQELNKNNQILLSSEQARSSPALLTQDATNQSDDGKKTRWQRLKSAWKGD